MCGGVCILKIEGAWGLPRHLENMQHGHWSEACGDRRGGAVGCIQPSRIHSGRSVATNLVPQLRLCWASSIPHGDVCSVVGLHPGDVRSAGVCCKVSGGAVAGCVASVVVCAGVGSGTAVQASMSQPGVAPAPALASLLSTALLYVMWFWRGGCWWYWGVWRRLH